MESVRHGGPKRTGSLERHGEWASGKPRWRGRVRLGDGTKSERIDVPEGMTEGQARAWLAGIQAEEDARGGLLAAKRERERAKAAEAKVACEGETADAWHERFLASREGKVGNTKDSRGRWRKWVSPILGAKPITAVTRDDVEAVRDELDAAIAAFHAHGRMTKREHRRLMPKAALNVWAVVTTAFKHASQAKRATGLRVREDNPCVNVEPPERGGCRRKTWIFPSEFLQLVSCDRVPREWRELYAIACYLYLRPGELFELRWKDVDLEQRVVSVSRSWDWEGRKAKPPKTQNGVRQVPIPEPLVPLLARMTEGREPEDKVVPVMEATGENKGARVLRDHLALAAVTNPRLTESSATRMPVGFRSWRDTGITWSAISGVDLHKLQRRAGHDDVNTTLAYVKEAEDRPALHGKVFPALPNGLVWPSDWPTRGAFAREIRSLVVPEEGVETRTSNDSRRLATTLARLRRPTPRRAMFQPCGTTIPSAQQTPVAQRRRRAPAPGPRPSW